MTLAARTLQPRARVIIDNDFAGDPDDYYQLAHHLLSPTVEIPFISVSGLPVDDSGSQLTAIDGGMANVHTLLKILGRDERVVAGSGIALADPATPRASDAARAIVAEAMREDTDLPLYVALGGGLTELASAFLLEPRIADRLTAIWIGGPEYEDSEHHVVDVVPVEYNLSIDLAAGQAIFSSPVPLWQVPNDAYRQCVVSWAELDARIDGSNALGELLLNSLQGVVDDMAGAGVNLGEVYVLGDNPLVALTALQGSFWPEPISSASRLRSRLRITADGTYGVGQPELPPVRVFHRIDTRSMFEDMFAKFAAYAG